jgi:glycosyltransferase involved in cell wall biosynthesis
LIFYAGNKLSGKGFNPTPIEFLSKQFRRYVPLITTSGFRNPVLRLSHHLWHLILNARKIKLVLIDTYGYRGFWIAFVVGMTSKLLGKPYLLYLHSDALARTQQKYPQFLATFFRNADYLLVPSEYLMLSLNLQKYEKVRVIPNLIEVASYTFVERKWVEPKLLWVRAFHENYDPWMAVEVLAELSKSGFSPHLKMIGPEKNTSLVKELKSQAKALGVADYLTIQDKQSKQSINQTAQDFDIFLNTSNLDNHPVTIIEAMAMGFPIVSTNAGGIPYLIEDGKEGLFVDKGDVKAITNQIKRLLNELELAHYLSRNARQKAMSYDWENHKTEWLDLFSHYVPVEQYAQSQ